MPHDNGFLKESQLARKRASLDQLVRSKEIQKERLTILAASGIFSDVDLQNFSASIAGLDEAITEHIGSIQVTAKKAIQKEAARLSG